MIPATTKSFFLIKFQILTNLKTQFTMADFVKQEDSKFALQLKAFSDGVNATSAPNGATVGLTSSECDEAKADALYVQYVMQQQEKAQAFSQAYTKFKNDLRKGEGKLSEPLMDVPGTVPTAVDGGVDTRFRQKAATVKNSTKYTTAIGEAWDIIAPAGSTDVAVPGFQLNLDAGHPIINWTKGNADAVDIWKDDGTGWKKLDR